MPRRFALAPLAVLTLAAGLCAAAPASAAMAADVPAPAVSGPATDTAACAAQIVPGCDLTFTIAPGAGGANPVAEYVWALDDDPITANPPASQVLTVTPGSQDATLTIAAPAPEVQRLNVFEMDTTGAESGITRLSFPVAGAPAVSFTAGASLQANFSAALADGQSFDNTMIDTGGTSCGTGSGDGTGDGLAAADLRAAGWKPGGTVTLDGTSLTLPAFGSARCAPDNLLAANQTIGAGPDGVTGSALVVLATSTDATAVVAGHGTGTSGSGVTAAEAAAPQVAGGTEVTGSWCVVPGGFAGGGGQEGCETASVVITYAPGCDVGQLTDATLTVPDWQSGPADIAAVTLPHEVAAGGGRVARASRIYAFALPLQVGCTVTSVTLPDTGPSTLSASASPQPIPALHIFALGVRDNTLATPEADGTAAAAPAGQAWTGALESPVQQGAVPASGGSGWGGRTIRIAASPGISTPAGSDLRVRLSDPAFQASHSIRAGEITVGLPAGTGSPALAGKPARLTFGGRGSVVLPAGGDVYSDPLTLPFAVTAGEPVVVSIFVPAGAGLPATLPANPWASGATEWVTAAGSGNKAGATAGGAFTAAGSFNGAATTLLTGIDVTTPAVTLDGVASPGAPTVVVAGDNLTDAASGGTAALPDGGAPSFRLAGQLASQGLAAGFGPVDAGLQSNEMLSDGPGGVSLMARVDRDILAEPDVGTVILDEGLEDVLQSPGDDTLADRLLDDYNALFTQLSAFGVNVIAGTLTPCAGYANSAAGDSCPPGGTADTLRAGVNFDLGNVSFCVAPFDQAVGSGSPQALDAADNAGDDVNLTPAGYAALAQAVTNGGCSLSPATPGF